MLLTEIFSLLLARPQVHTHTSQRPAEVYSNGNIMRHAGINGPYMPMQGIGLSLETPSTCNITNVYMIARQFEQRPSKNEYVQFGAVVRKIQKSRPQGDLAFFRNYTGFLDKKNAGTLTRRGVINTQRLASQLRNRYAELSVQDSSVMLLHADNKQSATLFGQAFGKSYRWVNNVGMSQLAESKNPTTCLTWLKNADQYTSSTFHPNVKRFGVKLNDEDVITMMNMCAYEISNGNTHAQICGLFTPDEWVAFSHNEDLRMYMAFGPGNPSSEAVGATYVNSTLQFLNQGEMRFFLEFGNVMDLSAFLSTLNLFKPPVKALTYQPSWRIADILASGSHVILERLVCGDKSYVRLLINEQVFPIEDCQNGPGYSCPQKKFESRLSLAESC